MNHLISVRSNVLYAKVEGEFKMSHELIFLLDKPTYRRTNDGEIVRERGIEEARFIVNENGLEALIEVLKGLKDAGENPQSQEPETKKP